MLEGDGFLYQGMRADKNRDLAVCDPFEKLRARDVGRGVARDLRREFLASASGQERDIDRQIFKIFDERLEMLACQYLRRRHIGDLQSPALSRRWPRGDDRV